MKSGNMTPQELNFWRSLSADVRPNAQVSFSYQQRLTIIQERLKDFFGDRADWKRCIEKYYSSADYQTCCGYAARIEDIPELSEADITRLIVQEDEDTHSIEELKALQKAISEADSKQQPIPELFQAAALLGLLPDSRDGLTSWFVDFSDLTPEENSSIMRSIREKGAIFSLIITSLIDYYYESVFATYPQCGTVITQAKRRYYYRGEHAYYGTSKPSISRGVDTKLPADVINMLLRLRLNEGCLFLDSFDAIVRWPYDKMVNHLAIAQHYGLKTPLMDVTNDLKTALFFACCKFDSHKRVWLPLQKDDFSEKSSRANIVKHGGDSRYAILYRTPSALTDMSWGIDENAGWNIITPIGYQPFMRCSAQHGYMLLPQNSNYDMLKDSRFCKFKIRLSEKMCEWVYDEMEQGEKIYPRKNDIPDISQYFEKINNSKMVSDQAFELMVHDFGIPKEDIDSVRARLKKYGISIGTGHSVITHNRLQKINRKYPVETALQLTPDLTVSRPILIIGLDQPVQEISRDGEKTYVMGAKSSNNFV